LTPLCDYNYALTASSTGVTSFSVLDPLLANNGILQQFPQQATPVYQNGTFLLRTRLLIERVEIRHTVVGAVSNAVLAADLYNNLRVAFYHTGVDYSSTNTPYLNGVIAGTTLQDVSRVYIDRTFALPSQAYDATITTPTPQVLNWDVFFEPNLIVDCYSANATGSGVAWDTNGTDVICEHISDSAVVPHPSVGFTLRMCYRYL